MTIGKSVVDAPVLPRTGAESGESRRRSAVRIWIERIGTLAEILAATLVLLLAVLISYEVVARYVFGHPTGFANQAAAYAMPIIAFFAAAATLRRNHHVAVDAVVNLLSARSRLRLAVLTEVLSLVAVTFMTWAMLMEVIDNYETGTRSFSTVITFPEYLPQVPMLIGLLILAGHQFLKLVDAIHEDRRA
jgi:TRAP-type C4-dicarboxylate transport system permease small subunit